MKNNFLKVKKIILIHFRVKNILKNNYYYSLKHSHTLFDAKL